MGGEDNDIGMVWFGKQVRAVLEIKLLNPWALQRQPGH